MVAQKLVLLAAIFAAARSQAPVGGELGGAHVARYLRGREDEEAPALRRATIGYRRRHELVFSEKPVALRIDS